MSVKFLAWLPPEVPEDSRHPVHDALQRWDRELNRIIDKQPAEKDALKRAIA